MSSVESSVVTERCQQPFFICTEVDRKLCIGTILRCATAFGAAEVVVIGGKHYSTHGSHGAHRRMLVRQFYRWTQCIEHFRSLYLDLHVIGIVFRRSCPCVASLDSSVALLPFDKAPFTGPTLLLLADVENGLNSNQLSMCSMIVFVPVPEPALEGQIHRDIKLSLVLQKVAADLGYAIVEASSSKFLVVDDPSAVHVVRPQKGTEQLKKISQAAAEANFIEEFDNDDGLYDLFGDES